MIGACLDGLGRDSGIIDLLRSSYALIGVLIGLVLGWPAFCAVAEAGPTNGWTAGFLLHEFDLTLTPGHRVEAAGPFFYSDEKGTQHRIGVPPLFSWTSDPAVEMTEIDILYPIMTLDRYGGEFRWQFAQLFSWAGGQTQADDAKRRLTLFPFYFQHRSPNPENDYTAVVPFYGTIKKRLTRDEIFFVGFPLYSRTKKKDIVTSNFLYPIFHLRTGNGLNGWQFWPLMGHEAKELTWKTNVLDEAVAVGGHEKQFYLWPLFIDEKSGLGTTNQSREQLFMPFYLWSRSPGRDATSYLWPIGYNVVDDRIQGFHEIGAPWPFIVFRRGASNRIDRVWPIVNINRNPGREFITYGGVVFVRRAYWTDSLSWERNRILYFFYSDMTEKKFEAGTIRRKTDLLPLFSARQEHDGTRRLQVLALLDPIFGDNKGIERDYAPLYSVWRSEQNPRTGASSESLLWNLYREERSPGSKKCSLLFGLVQYQSTPQGSRWRLFYIPLGSRPASPPPS